VSLAGCNAVLPSQSPTPTQEPTVTEPAEPTATEPAQPTATPTEAPADGYPPGVDESGVTDALALAESYTDALADTTFTVNHSVTVTFTNGTTYARTTRRGTVASRTEYHLNVTQSGQRTPTGFARSVEYYTANSSQETADESSDATSDTVYRRALSWNRNTSVNEIDVDPKQQYSRLGIVDYETVYSLLSTAETTTVTDRSPADGTPRVEIVVTGVTPSPSLGVSNVTEGTATLVVREDGILERFTVRYEATLHGESVTVVRTLRYDDFGTAETDRPAWLSENETASVAN
jgi:hypothetical protein